MSTVGVFGRNFMCCLEDRSSSCADSAAIVGVSVKSFAFKCAATTCFKTKFFCGVVRLEAVLSCECLDREADYVECGLLHNLVTCGDHTSVDYGASQ